MTKTAPYVSAPLRKFAAQEGFDIEIRVHTAARKNGWPQNSARPVHLLRDGKHVASFANGSAALAYLIKQTGNA